MVALEKMKKQGLTIDANFDYKTDALSFGTVSGSGTGHLDYGATGPVPDTEPRL